MSESRPARPAHRTPRLMAVVAAGGALGAVARSGMHDAVGGPWATFTVNVIGSFVLGLLLEALTRRGPDEGGRRILRLFAGTGFCGAFTTYSSFAHDVTTKSAWGATGWGIGQVVAGLLAAALGAVAGARIGAGAERGTR